MAKKLSLPKAILISMRPFQWTKNLAVFAAIIFNGKLFDPTLFRQTVLAFIAFCLLSSASYLINDIVDAPLDRKHPQKKDRPIASGELDPDLAKLIALGLIIVGLGISISLGWLFLFLVTVYIFIHLVYSFFLKKLPILDIFGISVSFIFRTLGGVVATGFHLPVWLMFTVVFLSLFIASGKRRSELILQGDETRPALGKYKKGLLNFYLSIFAVSTLLSYSLFAYLIQPAQFGDDTRLQRFLMESYPNLVNRKWLMLTIFPVILGIMRYSQLVLERKRGQRPTKVLASDIPLLFTVMLWGLMVIVFIYAL
jgi:4-hydroxybenzoate polyprenyltransferase